MSEKPKNLHEGHRKRLRDCFLRGGFEALSPVNQLELLLFYAIPRRDTNPIAHALLDRFGSLAGVLNADQEHLLQVHGISENSVVLIRLIGQLNAAAEAEQVMTRNKGVLRSTAQCAEYLMPHFFGLNREVVYLLCLDSKCKVLTCRKLNDGTVNVTDVSVRLIMETALNYHAASVVLAHNHPGSLCSPSEEDAATTLQIWKALDAIKIQFIDHIIVSGNEYYSMADAGFFETFLR